MSASFEAIMWRSLLYGSLFFCTGVHAQRVVDISDLELDLKGLRIAVDTIVLGFAADQPLGNAHAALSGNDKALRFQTTTDKALAELIRRSASPDTGLWHVGLKVNVLRLEDHMIETKQIASCSMHIEFVERSDQGWMRCYDHGANLTNERIDADRWDHSRLLAKCLEEIFRGAWRAHENGALRRVPVPLNAQPTPVLSLELPITLTAALRPGIYRTFQDFRLNAIDTTLDMSGFAVTEKEGAVIRGQFGKAAEPEQHNAWGCSDGKRLYINVGSFFVPLTWDGEGFRAKVPMGDAALKVGPGASIFGFPGYSAVMFSRTSVVTGTTVELDLLSGRIVPLLDTMADGAPSRARFYSVYSELSAIDSTADLFVHGGKEASLRPDQYYLYEPLRRADALPVEVRCGKMTPTTLYLDTKVLHDQVFLITTKRNGTLVVDLLRTMMAKGIISELKPENAVAPDR